MAFFVIDRNANAAQLPLNGKSTLVSARNNFEQMQRESAEMTEAQIQSHYGFPGTAAQWNVTIDGIVTALNVAAVDNYISQLG